MIPKELYDKTFLKEELDLPYNCFDVSVLDLTRWSVVKEGIFSYQGKFYSISWSEGATEMQDEGPWEYDDPSPVEVRKELVMAEKWVPVQAG